jgi:outer membrane receptor protein involved in Fe transport
MKMRIRTQRYSVANSRHRRRQLGSISTLTAAVLSALYGQPACADEAALQEVVVTATRRALSVQDVPISITAVSGAALEQAGIQDIAGLAHSVAGVDYTDKGPFGGINGSTLIIRGLNSEPTGTLALATPVVPPVATYVDETPLFFNLRLQDLDHVEILRGPQGTLYGSGSLGGTIRFVQNAPDPKAFDAKAEVGISKTAHTHALNEDVSGMLNLPLSDTLAVRLNASWTDEAGFINQPNLYKLDASGAPISATPGDTFSAPVIGSRDGVNTYGYRTARVAALWKPNDEFHAQLSYYYQKSTGDGFPFEAPAVYGPKSLKSIDYQPEGTKDKVDLFALTVDYDMGFATMTSATSYAHHNNETVDDLTALYTSFSFYTAYYGGNPRALVTGHQGLDDKLFSQEFRLASKAGGLIDWVGGLFFKDQKTYIQEHEFYPGYDDFSNACAAVFGFGSPQCGLGEYYDVAPVVNGVPTVLPATGGAGIPLLKDQAYIGDFHTRFKDLAVFGEVTWHITTDWSLTGGARLFKQTVTQSQQTGLLFGGPDFVANESLSDEFRRALWKINTAYQIDKSNLVYATWSQGFRRGGVNALPPGEPIIVPPSTTPYVTPPGLTRLKPDTANNYEIGVKGTLENRLRYSAAIFDIEWHDIQEGAQLTPLVLPAALNVGNGYSRGVELELSASVTDHVSAQLGYTYDKTKLTSISENALIGLSVTPPPPGSSLPGTPEHSLALGVEYGHVQVGEGEMRFALSGHYQSPILPAISATIPMVGGYTTLDARTSFALSHWTATLYVNNLTDTIGVNSYTDPSNFHERYSALVSTPRTVGLTLAYSFKEH